MSQYTILVADDEKMNLQTILLYLKESGKNYKILSANNGEVACKVAESKLPDLVVIDWQMPVMSGIEAIRKLKSQDETKDIPIIMATGAMTSPENLQTALDAGAIDYIRKPIDKIELIARVQSALALSDSYKKIKEQNQQIKEKNHDITSSIVYARRIQYSILPDKSLLDSAVKEYFIYYKPKDIVSGDFYWFVVKRRGMYISAADCTGHGVPGALMSMLGVNALNQVLKDYGSLEPRLLLSELNEKVCTTLKQGYGKMEGIPPLDGMDIALCYVDMKKQIVSFSGAGRPVYYFHKGEFQMKKGATNPIGGTSLLYDNVEFEQHEIPYEEGDTFYMFSDGITDQFGLYTDPETGGSKMKKFGTRRFKQLLADIQSETMERQSELIEEALNDWKKDTPQTDDLVVVGFRL